MSGQMDISADEKDIGRFLARQRTQFVVPDYQRRYSWDEEQWSEFWDDLNGLREDRNRHFLGSIVVIIDRNDDIDEFQLVDGQQRVATISLILSILEEKYREAGEEEAANEIANELRDSYEGNEYKRLQLNGFDNEDYQHLLEGDLNLITDQETQLYKAYKWFDQRLDLEMEELREIKRELLSSMSVVQVTCDGELSAFRLFETLNNRGLDLSPPDLMKNHLFMVANDVDGVDYKKTKDYWETILEVFDGETKDLEDFFQHYTMASSVIDVSENVSKTTLYKKFRQVIRDILEDEEVEIEDYVSDMLDKAQYYRAISERNLSKKQADYPISKLEQINEKLRDLEAIKGKTGRVVLLRALEEFDDADDFLAVIRLIEVFVIRRRVVDHSSGSTEQTVYSKICSESFDRDDVLDDMITKLDKKTPNDREFESTIISENFPNSKRTKYLLSMMERHHFAPSGQGIKVSPYEVDIEHIVPQQVSADKYTGWVDYLGIDATRFENQYCSRIGNLTLLEESKNRAAGNNPFEDKKQKEYQTSSFHMTRALLDHEDWSTDKIETRSEELAEVAKGIWSYDNISS
ncbi:DUF262 domain-containing protein [Haloarchaeobius sp. DYHT-AS-18]|uniref:DUF262 domain-containing protein n=1 Tax=Haloarchaeobius sp. DYHT-AS-18 TaxID=3446117 RepID=UPI003EB7CF6C